MRAPPACAAVAVLTALALACGAMPGEPADVVRLYFETLGRDPIRNADLGSAAFHASHGLHLRRRAPPVPGAPPTPDPNPLQFAQMNWIDTERLAWYRRYIPLLHFEITRMSREGREATVTARVAIEGRPPFTQHFWLSQPEGGPWRIDHIEQEGVESTARIASFFTYPNAANWPQPGWSP